MNKTTKQIQATFVQLDKRVPGVLYQPPDDSPFSGIAVLVMHSDEDYLRFPTGPELAQRGHAVLCANVANKEGIVFTQIDKMKNVRSAVNYLRSLPDVKKVVLMGHSGGGTLMSAYQAVAENGSRVFQGEEQIYPYPDEEVLPSADGLMLLDSNWGNAAMQLLSLDPAVQDEASGRMINEELDLFSEKNGFDPGGAAYTHDFIRAFQKGQSARNMALLEYAMDRLMVLEEGRGKYEDDEPLIIPGSAQGFFNNKLYAQDPRLMHHTRGAYLLLHPDGTRSVTQVTSIRGAENPVSLTGSFWEGARFLSVRTYLSSYAVRTEADYGFDEDNLWGVDWHSTYSCPVGNVEYIHVPTLVMGMTAGWEFLAAETIYEHAAAEDKTIAFVEGATHKFTPAHHMEQVPGQFGDTMKTLHDFVDEWLRSHF